MGQCQIEETFQFFGMNQTGPQRSHHRHHGVAMVELIVAGMIAVIVISAVGVLIDGGNRAWLTTYNSVYGQSKDDATTITSAFTHVARKSNRISYVLYDVDGSVFTPVASDPSESEAIVEGDAVEFRYWDVELDSSDSHGIVDTDRIASAYALFYIENGQFKVDYGPYPPGAINSSGRRQTAHVNTIVLADHVSAGPTIAPFSHTTQAGVGLGCVRLNVIVTDPDTGETTRVMTAALMRNIWPR